ncbi:hypothetical protein Tco_0265727 [Tanacetum coccineum]
MQQYRASVYMLPDTVIKDLEKNFKIFLWNVGTSAKGKARGAWNLVFRPKEQGGLGIKPLKRWNEVLLTDCRRQAQMVETLRVMRDMRREMSDMQAELLALREQQRRARQPAPDARIPDHQDASGDADSHV